VTAVVGISRFILDRHRAFGYFSDVEHQTVIHNPFPIRDKSAAEPPEPVPTKETGGPLRVGFLGRLSPMKGIDDLLHAVDNLPEECINLRIGGEGTTAFVDSLKATYASTPATFCGFVDPDEFLPGIDTLVVPSRWHEPFGRVVIEAYAHGTPVVVARRGGLPEIVEDGETGWTYDPDDDGALRRRLTEICRTPRRLKEMQKNIVKKSNQFGLKEHASEYEKVYQSTLSYKYLNIS
jgi:glycosyltransferase involved in cell wall biosynthesis